MCNYLKKQLKFIVQKVPANRHPRRIQNSFRVGWNNQTGASQSVHEGEALWFSATLTPTSPPPTTSINSSSPFDSPHASKHSTLVVRFSSTTISARRFGYYGGCTTDETSPMLEAACAKWLVTFSSAKLDFLHGMAWLLYGIFISLFVYIENYLFFNSEYFFCQQWRQHAFPRWHWGTILKCSSFHNSPFFNLFTSYRLQILQMITWLNWFNAIPWEHWRFSCFLRVDCCLLHFCFNQVNLSISITASTFHWFRASKRWKTAILTQWIQTYSMWKNPQQSWAYDEIFFLKY